MSITSLLFIGLALVGALIYQRLPSKLKNAWLLILSVVYLATWSWQFIIVLVLFSLANFALGIFIQNRSGNKKGWMWLGITLNLLVLFIFKYNHFYQPGFIALLQKMGFQAATDDLKILLPIGLSFLVVQCISYLVDIANQRTPAERNLLKFSLYILYFPKLLSGPVERARQFLPRLDNPLRLDRPLLERSLSLLLTGLFRKIFIADSLFRMIPENAFITPLEFTGQNLVFWLLAYAFALYNDFAGYTAIVRGISLWFGIELTNNFNLPYFSHNFTEFWNRWHISLSSWLRDYIFFPLSRSLMKRSSERTNLLAIVVPPLATMLVSGLWHGLSWSLLVWGGLHGVFLLGERVAGLIKRPVPINEQTWFQKALGITVTFVLTMLVWIPFRMDLVTSFDFLKGMFKWVMPSRSLVLSYLNGTTNVVSWSPLNLPNPVLVLMLILAVSFDLIMKKNNDEREIRSLPVFWQVVILVIMGVLILVSLFSDTAAPFVYQGF